MLQKTRRCFLKTQWIQRLRTNRQIRQKNFANIFFFCDGIDFKCRCGMPKPRTGGVTGLISSFEYRHGGSGVVEMARVTARLRARTAQGAVTTRFLPSFFA
jgi:hypothetical protein